MLVIPSIDISNGKCVRLRQGNFNLTTEYPSEPKAAAEKFFSEGATYLHIVDLDGAKEGRISNWKTIEELRTIPNSNMQIGGGIRSTEDVDRLLKLGFNRVVIGSIAITNPTQVKKWSEQFGPENFCIALDVSNGKLVSRGWQKSESYLFDDVMKDLLQSRFRWFLSTDVQRDGMLQGPNLAFYKKLVIDFPQAYWIASGGVTSKKDISSLAEAGVFGAIIGKALHEGLLTLPEVIDV